MQHLIIRISSRHPTLTIRKMCPSRSIGSCTRGATVLYYSALGGGGSIPYTLVLDADGVIRHTFTGAIDYDTLLSAVNSCR